jgi:hypothetical protein
VGFKPRHVLTCGSQDGRVENGFAATAAALFLRNPRTLHNVRHCGASAPTEAPEVLLVSNRVIKEAHGRLAPEKMIRAYASERRGVKGWPKPRAAESATGRTTLTFKVLVDADKDEVFQHVCGSNKAAPRDGRLSRGLACQRCEKEAQP